MSGEMMAGLGVGLLVGFIAGCYCTLIAARALLSSAARDMVDKAIGVPKAEKKPEEHPPIPTHHARPHGTFMACVFDNHWGPFVLLDVVGPMIRVQEHTDGSRMGRIATIYPNQVHVADRKRVLAMMASHPGGRTELEFDPNE